MGLFSSSKSSTSVTNLTQDNRIAFEDSGPQGVFLSPAATLTQTIEGNVGFSGDQVGEILTGFRTQQDTQDERSTDLTKSLATTFRGQTDKLTGIIEQLKTAGASNQKYLPYMLAALAALYLLRK